MYTLYWEKGSGSIVVQALLEEMGVTYDKYYVDMEAGEHQKVEYLRQNPTGLVPALMLPNSHTIGESAAIVLHLGEQCSDDQLIPQSGNSERPDFLYWLLFMATTGYTTFGRLAHPERYTQDQSDLEPVRVVAEDDVTRFFDVLEEGIKGKPYFLPCGYTALDIYLTMLAGWHPDKKALFQRNPKIAQLCAGVEGRPAYKKVI
ncbi:MAG: glutathione S-transferase family protein, partial [Gammaproteobacteria bacterium]|nr:glutathione S-transferase family protein [Gammaproteobacteria bacterium]